jgi:peptidoglycan-associated lipoprotein
MRNIPYLAVAMLAAACASNEPKDTAPVAASGATAPVVSTSSAGITSPATGSRVAGNPLHEPNNILAQRSIYFDFDSYAAKADYQPLIQAHSSYLTGHAEARVRIEGNCDERGSREYNLALGQRRAESVKKMMTVLGVPAGRVETVSYGEEKPVIGGHDEASWSKDRRDDIRYVVE